MATAKITITLPTEDLERARRAVKEGRATSVSAYISDAVDNRVRREEFQDFLDTCFDRGTPEEEAAAAAWAHRVVYGTDPQQ